MGKVAILVLSLFTMNYLFCISCYSQVITTFAGNGSGSHGGDGTPATSAQIPFPFGGVFDQEGNYYFTENGNRVRMVDAAGIVHTVAGNGSGGYSGDGMLATNTELNQPNGVAVDGSGNIYIADWYNYRVRKVDAMTHIISTVAGIGVNSSTGDGSLATSATLVPLGLCFDNTGNLYIIDSAVKIRKIDISGIIRTIAGTKIGGFSGDGGLATNAQLAINYNISMDASSDNLYIGCHTRVRKVNMSSGIISTFAGNGVASYSGDEIPATTAQIGEFGICLDDIGDLFIADYTNNRIRKVDTFGVIHTVAGDGTAAFGGDGTPATSAQIHHPEGVAIDACGNLYIADEGNNRIRKVNYPPLLTVPTISLSGVVSAAVGSTVTVTATVTNAGSSYIIHWMNHGIEFTTTTVPSVTYTKAAGIDTITARVVSTATYGCYDSTTSGKHIVSDAAEGLTPALSGGEGGVT